jgi:hypothetical protein
MKQTIPKRSNRFYDTSRFEYAQIRVYHKAAHGKHAPRYLLKCGDCDEKIEIHYGEDGLEIGGVHGSIEDWREILLPLLLIEEKGGRLVKHKPTPISHGPDNSGAARNGRKNGVETQDHFVVNRTR